MCRLLGVLTNDTMDFGLCLHRAPRSLAVLSPEHPDGWGIAAWEPEQGWLLRKRPACAQRDVSFATLAEETRGQLLVAHIRQRTVGAAILENTHPFRSGRWIFAHNGTIDDIAYLRSRISEERWVMIRGSTDSELLFAFLLTCLDEEAAAADASDAAVDSAIDHAMDELARASSLGSYNFVLSDGERLYAHRRGRSLYLLERQDETGQITALVASEAITDEPWHAVTDGSLVRCRRERRIRWQTLRPRSACRT